MKIERRAWAIAILAALGGCGGGATLVPGTEDAMADRSDEGLARAATSVDQAQAEDAIAALRRSGPAGLQALLRVHAAEVERLRAHPPTHPDAQLERVRHAIDIVSGQRDGFASGLYWHTDLESALREARATNKPILSLRLLGRLDEELSCANSRYFRLVLYPDPRVAEHLREHYVLHWSSERPAPRITIDMGDGRQIVRTITGNSVHYVLDSSGRPIDAIVGLYDADRFLAQLEDAEQILASCQPMTQECLQAQHGARIASAEQAWEQRRLLIPGLPSFGDAQRTLAAELQPQAGAQPSATVAMPLTASKMIVETPMLRMMQRGPAPAPVTEPDWENVARLGGATFALSEPSRSLLALKTRQANVEQAAQRLARSAAIDGARNDLLFHVPVHRMFTETGLVTFEALNARVYSELLRTPASDPWLGLRADDLYDGIEAE